MQNLPLSKSNKRIFRATLVILLIFSYGIYRVLAPPGPAAVCSRALRALERKDAEELARLADPEELDKLNLTTEKIQTILSETMWRGETQKYGSVKAILPTSEDMVGYSVAFAGNPNDGYGKDMSIIVNDSQKHGWRLSVSIVLWGACVRKSKAIMDGAREYMRYAEKLDIRGMRRQNGEYATMAEMQKAFASK